jgi:integrase/recombinase XerC/integrase/recombinase XerD
VSLDSLVAQFGPTTAVGELSALRLTAWFRHRHAVAAPATWNRKLATLRAAVGCGTAAAGSLGTRPVNWSVAVSGSSAPRALTRGQLERLFGRRDLPLRERNLWRLLYETAARANELLALDVEALDLANRRARVHSKNGAVEWVFWQTGSAQLLPRLLAGRTSGPVFLADRRPTRAAAAPDLDPVSGRASCGGRCGAPRPARSGC